MLVHVRRNYDYELGFSAFHCKAILEGKYVVELNTWNVENSFQWEESIHKVRWAFDIPSFRK